MEGFHRAPNLALMGALVLGGCMSASRTETGGSATQWKSLATEAPLHRDRLAMITALELALADLTDEQLASCRSRRVSTEVLAHDGVSESMRALAAVMLERRLTHAGCLIGPTPPEAGDAAPTPPPLRARLAILAWGWDAEATARETVIRERFLVFEDIKRRYEAGARVRAVATVQLDVSDGWIMSVGRSEGASEWRVVSGPGADAWPRETLPEIDEPTPRAVKR